MNAEENIRQIRKDLAEGYRYLEVAEAKLAQGNVPSAEVDEINKKAMEVEGLQAKVNQYDKIAGIAKKGREVKEPTMPAYGEPRRGIRTSPGDIFVKSSSFQAYKAQGMQGWSGKVDVKRLSRTVDLYGEEAEKYLARLESKDFPGVGIALPTIGVDSIIPIQRDPDLVRFEEPEILTMRDVLTVLPATSDTIRIVRTEYTRAAAPQAAKGGLKPYSGAETTSETVPVQTIAVLHKISEQDVEDSPRLVGIINGEMRLDVRVEEERQLLWGTGAGGEITGLYGQGVSAFEFAREQVGDTLIDRIRRMRTDLRKRGVTPNAVMIDPIDWENIELAKGSTNDHYHWGLISTLRGPMIWGLRVIESDAMTNPADNNSRRILMGDFVRGATLYDRHDVRLAVGYVDDDFARNLRTLRAEERLALGVKRAHAFSWTQTSAGES
jgi:hypothetical protein